MELGERLFFDSRLSANGRFSCGTCHVPERNWTDNRVRGADSLWSQSIRPILDRRELGATPQHVAELLRKDDLS